jgi:hypothetical protein
VDSTLSPTRILFPFIFYIYLIYVSYLKRIYGGSVAFDSIAIKGGSQPTLRGATLPYEEVEAENATYQGTLIGPDRKYPPFSVTCPLPPLPVPFPLLPLVNFTSLFDGD